MSPFVCKGHGCDNMTVLAVDLARDLLQQGDSSSSSSSKIILYGGGEDLYLGRDEAEFEGDDDDD